VVLERIGVPDGDTAQAIGGEHAESRDDERGRWKSRTHDRYRGSFWDAAVDNPDTTLCSSLWYKR